MWNVFVFLSTDKTKHVKFVKNGGHMFCQIFN